MLNKITIYIIERISINIGIISIDSPMCMGNSAKTAAANPFGKIIDVITASEVDVFLFMRK